MTRDRLRAAAKNEGWRRLEVWHRNANLMSDDYFVDGSFVVRARYDRLGRLRGADRWERGARNVERISRLVPGKLHRVLRWLQEEGTA